MTRIFIEFSLDFYSQKIIADQSNQSNQCSISSLFRESCSSTNIMEEPIFFREIRGIRG